MNKSAFASLVISIVLTSFSNSYGQYNETIRSGRPGQSIGPFTVGKGIIQLQTGMDVFGFENKSLNEMGDGYLNNTVVRFGLTERFEISALADYKVERYKLNGASAYESDFILFPEYFHAPLMATLNDVPEAQAIRKLADYTDRLHDKFREFAVSYNANIITGSMPLIRDGKLYNIGWLCRRNGTSEMYEKLHVTPSEKFDWGMSGGNSLKAFDTDCGKIGVLICYDVEFPELARLLADEGMNLLFIPFVTDTQNGYTRVKHCAQARAIENECFVAIAGCVGNLPKVHNMDIQYAQSAVFTPADFSFPTNAIKAEATPNSEMTLIVDVDLDLLKDLHYNGSVRTLTDRRTDIYKLERVLPVSKELKAETEHIEKDKKKIEARIK